MMFIFWILLIIPVLVLLRPLDAPVSYSSFDHRSALDILRERYARGEIDADEFRQRRQEMLR